MADLDADDREPEPLDELLARMVRRLKPHCDAVQIVAVRYVEADDETFVASDGAGNWQTRYGAMRSWMVRADARARRDAVRDEDDDD
jgi:hypothetical protein